MISLLLAVSMLTNCLQCVNGKIEVPCQVCKGIGIINKKGCRVCQVGLYSPTKIGSGYVKRPCKFCKGKKKLKKIIFPIDRMKKK